MKKIVLFAVSAALVLAFASMGMAVGHVGHVEDDAWVVVSEDMTGVVSAPETELGGGTDLSITNVEVNDTIKDNFLDNLGDIDMDDGTIDLVCAVVEIDIEHTGDFTGDVILDFSGTDIASANYLWIKNHPGTYDAFHIVNGVVTIPMADADDYFTATTAFATNVEEATSTTTTSGGGGGGCNLGAVGPLMGLLALPLVWLLK